MEILNCPDCGKEVANTPDNVTWGFEHDLVCPECSIKRENEFDYRGLIKAGRPRHHRNWNVQKPEFVYTGTDYFEILHPICSKSPRKDKKGFMEVNGVWVDDSGRIVLSLECKFCSARNALKPHAKEGEIPLLNESGGFLLIGVEDNKNVLGLENDYNTLKGKKNEDGFELQFTEVINRYIGKEYRKFLNVAFENIYGKNICYIEMNWRR